MTDIPKIVIVGGGISGLSAAFFLKQKLQDQAQIILLEKENRLGGLIQTERDNGFLIEGGPESFVSRKPAGIKLCEALGIRSELIESNQDTNRTFILHKKKFVGIPSGIFSPFGKPLSPILKSLLLSRLLSLNGKIRLMREPLVPRNRTDTDESLRDFIERRLGPEFYGNLFAPLFAGVYGGEPGSLSAKLVLREYVEAEKKYGSIFKALLAANSGPPEFHPFKSVFVTLKSGLGTLIERLKQEISPESIRLNQMILGITRSGEKYQIKFQNGQEEIADAIILSTAAYVSADLARDIDPSLSYALNQIQYASGSVFTFGFNRADIKHPLNGYGFLVPAGERLSFTACTWSSSKWDKRAPYDKVLLRTYCPGIPQNSSLMQENVISELKNILQLKKAPILREIHLHPRSLPQYETGHEHRLAEIKSRLSEHPGLYLTGAAYGGIGIPDCIENAKSAAEQAAVSIRK